MAGKLAEAYVEINADDRPLRAGLSSAEGMLGGATHRMSSMAAGLWAGVANAGIQAMSGMARGIASGMQEAVTKAGDLFETVSKVRATFGDAAGTIIAAGDQMAAKFGTNKQVFLDGAANIGLIAKGAGFATDKAADMGVQFAKLADDIASFDNVSVADAMVALRAGLVGETEPLRRFGVTILEQNTMQEAFRLGLGRTKAEITGQEKIVARASLIMKGFTDRIGDHERTQSSMNNQIREAQGRWENFRAELGTKLIPIMGQVSAGFSGLVKDLQDDFHTTGSALNEMGAIWKTVFTDMGAIMDGTGLKAKDWKDGIIATMKEVGGVFGDITGTIRAFEQVVTAAANRGKPAGQRKEFGLPDITHFGAGIDKVSSDPIGMFGDLMHELGVMSREADRFKGLDAAMVAAQDRNIRQGMRGFVGPPTPGAADLARGMDAADAAHAREAAVRDEAARLSAAGDKMMKGFFDGLFKAPGNIRAGLTNAVGVEKIKLPFQLNAAMATGRLPEDVRGLAGMLGMGGLADVAGGGFRAAGGIRRGLEAPRRDFQSTMLNTSDIASEVTKAALSHKTATEKNTEETARATKESAGYLKALVNSQGKVVGYARFAPRGAK